MMLPPAETEQTEPRDEFALPDRLLLMIAVAASSLFVIAVGMGLAANWGWL